MAKTVNEAMTAIADVIREKSTVMDKLTLNEMPDAINQACSENRTIGYQTARDEAQAAGYKLQKRLEDSDDPSIKDLEDNVDTAIADFDNIKTALVNQNVEVPDGTPTSEYYGLITDACNKNYNDGSSEGYQMGYNERGAEFDQTMSQIDSNLENTVGIANNYLSDGEVPANLWDKISYLDEKIPKVYENGVAEGAATTDGYKNAVKEFWGIYQDYGNRKNYRNAFWNSCWTDGNYNPQYDFIVDNGSEMFRYAAIEDTKKTLDFSNASTTSSRVFANMAKLKTISKLIVSETVTFSYWFEKPSTDVHPLENIVIEGTIGNDIDFKDCTKLSRASIENIIGVLSDTAEGKTITLSLEAVNKAFQTSDGLADGSTSQEWITLITPKSNVYDGKWTITLV